MDYRQGIDSVRLAKARLFGQAGPLFSGHRSFQTARQNAGLCLEDCGLERRISPAQMALQADTSLVASA
jgi:hypothetical protein